MEETLKEYLDRAKFDPNQNFIIYIPEEKATMAVCKRYLQCKVWQHILDYKIIDYKYPVIDIFGCETIKFILSQK